MGIEIERKFLVDQEKWKAAKPAEGEHIRQGYLLKSTGTTVRIRIRKEKGFITVKGKTTGEMSRLEFEYEIPKEEAVEMLHELCPKWIDKTRYLFKHKGFVWEVDEFESPKKGLILAEIELSSELEEFSLPDWVKEEVTGQPEYYNANML